MEFWTHILNSNLLNFLIVLFIIFLVNKKIRIEKTIENLQKKIKETIDNSTKEKEASILKLKKAKETFENISVEIEKIEKEAIDNSKIISEKILNSANKEVNLIKENMSKIFSLEEQKTIQNLSKKTVSASVKIAKNHLISLLKENPIYHEELINNSIDELNRLEI